jgi:FkbM family methyltransferase
MRKRGLALIKQAVQKFVSAFGYALVPLDSLKPTGRLLHFFPLLRSFGFAPKHIWDVGANRGEWTRVATCYFPNAEYTLLEPQDRFKNNIQDLINGGKKIRWINAGAGAQPGILPFYVVPGDQGSTFLGLPRVTEEAVQCIQRSVTHVERSKNFSVLADSGDAQD